MGWGQPGRERRVLKAGHSSIAVTLPKPWAEAMRLRPGDVVVFDQNDDGTLYLKPAPPENSPVTAPPYLIQAQSFDDPGLLKRLVVGAYRSGHDAVEIRSGSALAPERVEELLDAARGLLGVSIVAQEPNRVLLQNFIDPSKYGLPQLVQRMKMILVAYIEEAESVVTKRVPSRRLASFTEEANKVFALLVRQLFLASRDWSLARRIGSPDPRQLLEWRVVVQTLEEIGRLLADIAETLNHHAEDAAVAFEGLPQLLGEFKLGLKTVVDTLMHPTLTAACDAYAESNRIQLAARELGQKAKAAARKNGLTAAIWALGLSAGRLSSLAEVALDRAVATGNEMVLLPSA
ncbi:MAG: AbrB/MazE/SpoVT family DNA-binding domain-containing protein [Thermoplasmata archaeon]|nr:AbrB/MazE/SpoVT family DNA-binding domain-containing protein [Thermoplasmata archaeon]